VANIQYPSTSRTHTASPLYLPNLTVASILNPAVAVLVVVVAAADWLVLLCPVEIMFLVDSSEKAKALLFEKQKEFVLRLSERLARLQSAGWRMRVRMSALQYSSSVSVEHNFRDWQDVDVFRGRVAAMAYIGQGTYSAYALANATRLFVQETSPGSLRVALLMSDGVDHPRSPSAMAAAAEAKNHNIRVFAVRPSGLPRDAGERLRSIASAPPHQHVFSLADPQVEDRLLKELVCTPPLWDAASHPVAVLLMHPLSDMFSLRLFIAKCENNKKDSFLEMFLVPPCKPSFEKHFSSGGFSVRFVYCCPVSPLIQHHH